MCFCLFILVTASQYSSECQKISPVDWDELFWKEGVGMEKRKERKGKSTSTLWVNISYKNCCICYWGPQSKFLENQYYSPSITFGRGMISFHFCMTALLWLLWVYWACIQLSLNSALFVSLMLTFASSWQGWLADYAHFEKNPQVVQDT